MLLRARADEMTAATTFVKDNQSKLCTRVCARAFPSLRFAEIRIVALARIFALIFLVRLDCKREREKKSSKTDIYLCNCV